MERKAVYGDYLQLEKLLTAQQHLSATAEHPAHEEMLFIIMHQVYELWFKQILWDLDSILDIFRASGGPSDLLPVIERLGRINKIFRLLIQQFDVIETMTPLQFLNFRGQLGTMSGFQSFQFRLMETKFGLKRRDRLLYNKCPVDIDFCADEKEALLLEEKNSSLFDCLDQWLVGLPFLERGDFRFIDAYKSAVEKMIVEETRHIHQNPRLMEDEKENLLKALELTRSSFDLILDREKYQELLKQGHRHLSYKGFMTVLFIRLYRHHPSLNLPDMMLTELHELNAHFSLWRYRHIAMVEKMIGWKRGTGGSSGIPYLMETIDKHNVFTDLSSIPMLLLPEWLIPPLPEGFLQ